MPRLASRLRWLSALPLFLTALASLCALSVGCISRKWVVVTDPPGVQVFIDGKEVGWSRSVTLNDERLGRLEVPFDHYGRSEIVLKLPDHESQTHYLDPGIPAYEYFPLDFFADVLWPGQIEAAFTYRFSLEPVRHPSPTAAYTEAEAFRDRSGQSLLQEPIRRAPR